MFEQNFGFPDKFFELMRAHEGRHTDIYSVKLPMMDASPVFCPGRPILLRKTARNVGSGESDRG